MSEDEPRREPPDVEIPQDWESVLNAPLRWMNRRVRPRYRRAVLLILLVLVAVPIVWKAWEKIGAPILRPRGPTLLVLPHYDFPYGFAYWRNGGNVERSTAYPFYKADMHATSFGQANDAASDAIRDAYRITVANPSDSKFVVTNVTMHLRRYEKLPERYVCIWSRKGLAQVVAANFDLRPDAKEARLIGEKEVIDLPPGEAQVIIARVRDATPGVYTFSFSAIVQSLRGRTRTIESAEFRLFVPNREPKNARDPRGISVAFSGDDRTLVPRLLGLDTLSWQKLRDATNPRSLDLDHGIDVGAAVADDDGAFVQRLLQQPSAGVPRADRQLHIDCNASTLHAADCAPLLLAFGRDEEATRVLRDGLARAPDDARAAALLTALLVHKNRRAAARQVWEEAYRASPPNEALYHAGFALTAATGDVALAEKLAVDAGLAFPDSVRLLDDRLRLYEQQHRPADAFQALTAACRHYPRLRERDEQQTARRAIFVTTVHMSNRGEPGFAAWLSSVLLRCPATIVWDLRTSPSLWHYDPFVANPFLEAIPRGADGIAMARALVASGRPKVASAVLAQIVEDETSSPALRTEAREIIGDILLAAQEYDLAGDYYLVAYDTSGLPKVRMEAIAVKAALSYYLGGSGKIATVFETAGPRKIPAADVPGVLEEARAQLGKTPKGLFVLYDPLRADERTYGLMTLFYAFTNRSVDYAVRGLVATLAALEDRGMSAGDLQALQALTKTLVEWKSAPQSHPALPAEFLDRVRDVYMTESAIFEIDEDAPTAAPNGQSSEQLLLAAELSRALGIKDCYFVRTRIGTAHGCESEQESTILSEHQQSYAAWRSEQLPLHRDAPEGVYLEKLKGRRYAAEREFREGLKRAYHFYELESGLKDIEASLAEDPKNVHALKIAAQLNAVLRQPQQCIDLTARALALDPHATGVAQLQAHCRHAAARAS